MNPLFQLALIGFGALGATVFLIDYLRTANLSHPFARLIIALNASIAVILWLSVLGRFDIITGTWRVWVSAFFFVIVDIALWYQWVLLRRYRKRVGANGEEEEDEIVNEEGGELS